MIMISDITIDRLFYKDRFPESTWKVIFLLLYSPVGILLALIRMCMVLQAFVAASLLRSQVPIRRFILRVVCCALGIIIEENQDDSDRDKNARFLISNHLSIFDCIPIHLLTNCQTLVYCDLPDWLLHCIGLKNIPTKLSNSTENMKLAVLRTECKVHKESILMFPEVETTNGEAGLLKFDNWWISEVDSVQPIALKLRRPSLVDIKPSVLGSTWYSDYFWSFFVPYTVYSIHYLPIVEKISSETDNVFVERIQAAIAEKLGIAKTKFTALDKMEYEKRFRRERQISPKSNQLNRRRRDHDALHKMVIQVAEVLPHVPRDVVLRDLENTGNVDVTITNILEGKVQLTSLTKDVSSCRTVSEIVAGPSSAPTQSYVKPEYKSFQERKAQLIEDARKKYLAKHQLQRS